MRKRGTSIALGATAALVPLLVAMQSVVADSPDSQAFGQIQNGRYLAIAADCAACHTVPDTGKPFAGGRAIETPFGNIVAPNITPDRDTGIGAWSDDEFDDAVRRGIRPNGARLYPAMPYTAYTKMSRADVLAIRAYLKTVAPVQNRVVANTLPFPFNVRAAMRVWDALYFTAGEFTPAPPRSAEWNRGAFLVQGAPHCGACHTPKSFFGGGKTSENLRGANLQGWFAPDITNDARTGLGRWSPGDITAYLKTGHNRMTAATGPMAEMIADSTSQMTDSDLAAIATYLKSLPGRDDNPTAVIANDPFMVAGQAIYRDQCSACHALDGKGVPQLFPSLADSSLVRSSDGHIDPRRSSRCAQRRDGGRAHRAGNAVVRLATRRCPGRGGPDLYPQRGRRSGGAGFSRRRKPRTVGAARTNGLARRGSCGPMLMRPGQALGFAGRRPGTTARADCCGEDQDRHPGARFRPPRGCAPRSAWRAPAGAVPPASGSSDDHACPRDRRSPRPDPGGPTALGRGGGGGGSLGGKRAPQRSPPASGGLADTQGRKGPLGG